MIGNWNAAGQNTITGTPEAVGAHLEKITQEIQKTATLLPGEDPGASRKLLKLLKEELDIRLKQLPNAIASDQMGHVDPSITAELIKNLDSLNALLVTIYYFLYNYDKLDEVGFNSVLYAFKEVLTSNKVDTDSFFRTHEDIFENIIPVLFPVLSDIVIEKINKTLIRDFGMLLASDGNNSNFNYISSVLRRILFKYFPVSMGQCRTKWFRLLTEPYTVKYFKEKGISDKVISIFNQCTYENIECQNISPEMEEKQLEKIRSILSGSSNTFTNNPYNIYNFLWIQIGKEKTLALINKELDDTSETDESGWRSRSLKVLKLQFFISSDTIFTELERSKKPEELCYHTEFIAKLAYKFAVQGEYSFALKLVDRIISLLQDKDNKLEADDFFSMGKPVEFTLAALSLIPSNFLNNDRIRFFHDFFAGLFYKTIESEKDFIETIENDKKKLSNGEPQTDTIGNLEIRYYYWLFLEVITAPFKELLKPEPWESRNFYLYDYSAKWKELELMFTLFLETAFKGLPVYLYKFIVAESISIIASCTFWPKPFLLQVLEYFENKIFTVLKMDNPEENIVWTSGFTSLLGVYSKMGLVDKADALWAEYEDHIPWYNKDMCFYGAVKYEQNDESEQFISLIKDIIDFPNMPEYYNNLCYSVLEAVKNQSYSKDELYKILQHIGLFGSAYYLEKPYEKELYELAKYLINSPFSEYATMFIDASKDTDKYLNLQLMQLRKFVENKEIIKWKGLFSKIIETINSGHIYALKGFSPINLFPVHSLRNIESILMGENIDEAFGEIQNLDNIEGITECGKNLALSNYLDAAEQIMDQFTELDKSPGAFLNKAVVYIMTGKEQMADQLLDKHFDSYLNLLHVLQFLKEIFPFTLQGNYLERVIAKIPVLCHRSGYLEASDYPELYMRFFFDMDRTDLLDSLFYYFFKCEESDFPREKDSDWHCDVYQILLNCEYRGLYNVAELWADKYISLVSEKLDLLKNLETSMSFVLSSILKIFPEKDISLLHNLSGKSGSYIEDREVLKFISTKIKVLLDVKNYEEASNLILGLEPDIILMDYNLILFTTRSSLEQSSPGYAGVVKTYLEKLSKNTDSDSLKIYNDIILTWTENIIPFDADVRPVLRSCTAFPFLTIESKSAIFHALERFEFAGTHSPG